MTLLRSLVTAPRAVLLSAGAFLLTLAVGLIALGLWLYVPPTATIAAGSDAPAVPADFTPLASPPPAFDGTATPSATAPPAPTAALGTPAPTLSPTAIALEDLFGREAARSDLRSARIVSVLLLGTDARLDEGEVSRSDTIIAILLDLDNAQATVISIPRDLWVTIPGYDPARVNTAYFLGQAYGYDYGPELARQTVSQLLGITLSDTVVVDFDGFRALIDRLGGIEIVVPEAIDDPLYPDENYGTFRLVIPAGRQQFDGEQALRYARTRHGDSDLSRAERQQLVMQAVRAKLLQPEHLARLPLYLRELSREVTTTLTLPDLFFLARFAAELDDESIHMHVIQPPLLWPGVTGDGQQVLLYDAWSLQVAVQGWLADAAASGRERVTDR